MTTAHHPPRPARPVVCLRRLGIRHQRGEEDHPCRAPRDREPARRAVGTRLRPGPRPRPRRRHGSAAWSRFRLRLRDDHRPGPARAHRHPARRRRPSCPLRLNRFFLRPAMIGAAQNTRLAAAGDVCRFLRFLHGSRGGKSWRDAAEEDHAAFLYWRRFDPAGPRVAASTLNRELAQVNGFFSWAARQRLVAANPVPHRTRRAGARWQPQGDGGPTVPAAQARDADRDQVRWLTPAQYWQWRDAGPGFRSGFRFRCPKQNYFAMISRQSCATSITIATVCGILHKADELP